MHLQIQLKNGVMTAHLSGEIDHHTADVLRRQIDATAEKMQPRHLRLDFSEVSFMDSSGIGLILGRVRQMKIWSGTVSVCGLSPQLRRVAELSGVGTLATIEKDRWEEAQ